MAKKIVYTEFKYRGFCVDVSLRYLVFFLWRSGHLSSIVFWALQIFVVTFLAAIIGNSERYTPGDEEEFKFAPSTIRSIVVAIFVLNGIAHTVIDTGAWISLTRFLLSLLLLFGLLLYYMLLAEISRGDIVAEPEPLAVPITQTEASESEISAKVGLGKIDANDEELTRLQTELTDVIRKVDSYTIESVLIGALSFSAFVTIVTSEKVGPESLYRLGSQFHALAIPFGLSTAVGSTGKTYSMDVHALFTVIALMALICAMFLMAVIAARLRFNMIIRPAQYSIQMASIFNDKEERLADQLAHWSMSEGLSVADAYQNERLQQLRASMDHNLAEAKTEIDHLAPTISYMTLFRTLGVISFLITLVVSALWFAPLLAGLFLVLSIVTFVYPYIDSRLRDGKLKILDFFTASKR